MIFFTEIKKNLKIRMETPRTLNRQSNPEQEEQRWSHHTDCKIYNKAIVSKTVWYQHKTDIQTNVTKQNAQKKNACIYGQPIFSKVAKNIQWKRIVYSIICAGKTRYSYIEV